jgi:hypothetical protein
MMSLCAQTDFFAFEGRLLKKLIGYVFDFCGRRYTLQSLKEIIIAAANETVTKSIPKFSTMNFSICLTQQVGER